MADVEPTLIPQDMNTWSTERHEKPHINITGQVNRKTTIKSIHVVYVLPDHLPHYYSRP